MEEQVGMMAHNEKYKQSIEADDLFQESVIPNVGSNNMIKRVEEEEEEEPISRHNFKMLNPTSTTSSLEPVEPATALLNKDANPIQV